MQALADPLPAAEAAAASAPRVRVLIADDDEQIREVLVDLIELVGGDAQAVATGEQAIAAVQAQTFDLALLDLHMPGLDGWSLARELRQLAVCPRLVALSGAIDPRAAAQLRASGFDDAVAKPPSLARLEGLLHFDRPASKV
jgi:CheY-like chemotaxis protein